MGKRRGFLGSAIVCVALLPAVPAGAATQVGEVFAPAPGCNHAATLIQSTSPGGHYVVPLAGVITEWRYQAGPTAPTALRLKLARDDGGNNFTILGQSELRTNVTPNALNTYATQLPVQGGELLGLYMNTSAGDCGFRQPAPGYVMHATSGDPAPGATALSGPNAGRQVDVSATLEPDCDGDGLGDESQDGDISSCAPGDVAAPNAAITDGPKKKTRKKTATFRFSGTDAKVLAGFECSLDGAPFASCTSPHKVKVKRGKHTFSVRATDQAGNVDGSPATYKWKVKKKRQKK